MQIAFVTAPVESVLLKGLLNGALGFVQVQTVMELTEMLKGKELREVIGQLLSVKILNPEKLEYCGIEDR